MPHVAMHAGRPGEELAGEAVAISSSEVRQVSCLQAASPPQSLLQDQVSARELPDFLPNPELIHRIQGKGE